MIKPLYKPHYTSFWEVDWERTKKNFRDFVDRHNRKIELQETILIAQDPSIAMMPGRNKDKEIFRLRKPLLKNKIRNGLKAAAFNVLQDFLRKMGELKKLRVKVAVHYFTASYLADWNDGCLRNAQYQIAKLTEFGFFRSRKKEVHTFTDHPQNCTSVEFAEGLIGYKEILVEEKITVTSEELAKDLKKAEKRRRRRDAKESSAPKKLAEFSFVLGRFIDE